MAERAIELTKHRSITLEKGIRRVKIELLWDENRRGPTADIDLICIEVDANGRALSPDHLVFFNSIVETDNHELTDPEHAVLYSGDDTGEGNEDGKASEDMDVIIGNINPDVQILKFFANIYDAHNKRQSFKDIRNASVRVYQNGSDTPSIIYQLDDYRDATFLHCCSLERVEGRIFKFVAESNANNNDLLDNLQGYGLKFK